MGIYCNDKVRQMPNILELPDTRCCFVSFLFFPDYVRMFGGVVYSVGSFWVEGQEVGDGDFVLECAVNFSHSPFSWRSTSTRGKLWTIGARMGFVLFLSSYC